MQGFRVSPREEGDELTWRAQSEVLEAGAWPEYKLTKWLRF